LEQKVGVLVLSRNRLLRESVVRLLAKKTDFNVVAPQMSGLSPRNELEDSSADVLVTDSIQLILENEPALLKAAGKGSAFKCLLIAMQDDPKQFLAAVRHGALGYVLQDASAADVVTAIRAVAMGEAICPPSLVRHLFDYVMSKAADQPNNRARVRLGLTRREQQLIPLIGRGLTNKEIANQLNLSEQTVKNHVHRILRKVGVEDRLRILEALQTQELNL
jgi:DNA-binding NarL/FixJ family response regulator